LLFYHLTLEIVLHEWICCNPEIPGLGCPQYRDSGLAKMAGIRDTEIAITTR